MNDAWLATYTAASSAAGRLARPKTCTGKNNPVDTVAQTSLQKLNALRLVRSKTHTNGNMTAIIMMRGTARENEVTKKAMARALAPKSKLPFPLAELDELPSAAAAPAARVTTDPRRAVVGRLASSETDTPRNDESAAVMDAARIAARGATQRPRLLIRWLDNDVVVVVVIVIRALATRVVVVVDPPRTRVVTGAIVVGVGVIIIVGVIIVVGVVVE